MGKPEPETTSGVAAAPVQAVPGNAEDAVIRATKENPWPEPPSGGNWVRNATTGDLTLMAPSGVRATPEERDARRKKQRDEALRLEEQRQAAAAKKTNSKE